MSLKPRRTAAVAAAVLGLSLSAAAVHPAYADEPTTIAEGLHNPRQLTITPGQQIYVAEAGTPDNCEALAPPLESFEVCDPTGSVTEINGSTQKRVVTDAPTMTFNGELIGASDVDVRGNNVALLIGGMAGAVTERPSTGPNSSFGTLRTGRLKTQPIAAADLDLAADLAQYELDNDPDGNLDTNAVGFAATDSKNWVVTDAGGNDLVAVGTRGESTISVFPDGPPVPNPFGPGQVEPQAVPTDVAIGPDGAYYISQLTGFPFPEGASTIWRVTPDGQRTVYATGLTMVTSLAWQSNTLYAVQLDDSDFFNGHVGSLRKVNPNGAHEVVVGDLPAPYGLAIRGKSAYVTTNSISPTDGSVIKVDLT